MYDVEDHNREILMDMGPDKPTLASDAKRKNTYSGSKINLREKGSRWRVEPEHNDINLSLTGKDPRGTSTEPDFSKIKENAWGRKDDYKYSFLPTANNSVPTMGVSESQLMSNKLEARKRVQKMYYKDFDTSKDTVYKGYTPVKSTQSKTEFVKHSNKLEEINDQKNIKKKTDIISTLASVLPIGHSATTETSFNTADYNLLYKNKSKETEDFMKVKYNAEKTGKPLVENKENKMLKQLTLFVEDIASGKTNLMNKNQEIKYGAEKIVNNRDMSHNKEYYSSESKRAGEVTQKDKQLVEQVINNYKKSVDTFNKNNEFKKTDMELPETIKSNGETMSIVKKLSVQNKGLKSSIKDIIETHNKGRLSMCNSKDSIVFKHNNNIVNKPKSSEEHFVDFKSYNKIAIDSLAGKKYKTNTDKCNQDKVAESKKDFDNFALEKFNSDVSTKKYKTNDNLPNIASIGDTKLDNKFGDNSYVNRKTGPVGEKYMFNHHNTDQTFNGINDNTTKTYRSSKYGKTRAPINNLITTESKLEM